MRYLIVDLEATCWRKRHRTQKIETIEIGAVLMATASGPISGEFSEFIRPICSTELSDFCTELTSIRQADVDSADPFSRVFPRFVDWIGPEPFRFCSWGGFDQRQLEQDCERHRLTLPKPFEAVHHLNLKRLFAEWKSGRQMGMATALEMLEIPLEGMHHRGIDDARNLAKLATLMLPAIRPESPPTAVTIPLIR